MGFVVDKVAPGQVFSAYLGFPCQLSFYQIPILITTRGRYKRQISGRSADWTQLDSAPPLLEFPVSLSPLSLPPHLGLMIKFLATRLHLYNEKIPETIHFNIEAEGSRFVRNVNIRLQNVFANTEHHNLKKKIAATKIMETVNTVTLGVSHGITLQMGLYSLRQN
jgi:hypothetical protein